MNKYDKINEAYHRVLEAADWEGFYKMAKDKSGKTMKQFEKKYGGAQYQMPHVQDALKNTKDFKSFMKIIKRHDRR